MSQAGPPIPASENLLDSLKAIRRLIEQSLTDGNQARILGADIMPLLRQAKGTLRTARRVIITLALLGDCLRVAELAIAADGAIPPEEINSVLPLVSAAARFLSIVRPGYYQNFEIVDHARVPAFLKHYKNDAGLFGNRCTKTRWLGLTICRCVAVERRDAEALDTYERMVTRLMDGITAQGSVTPEKARIRDRLRALIALHRKREVGEVSKAQTSEDSRVKAFCDPKGPAVFTTVAHAHQIWERDPFDVEAVHSEARDAFERLINRATLPDHNGRGRMLLVLGESGSGKTHLMRVFRSYLHSQRLGLAAYMQMSSRTEDYSRYALINLIDSLERPYDPPHVESSGLMNLSDAVAQAPEAILPEQLVRLRDGTFDNQNLGTDFISPLVDRLLWTPTFQDFDPDLLRALLFLQRRDPPLKARVLKYLRCEYLNAYDRQLLGDIAPLTDEGAPQRMIEELGRLMWQSSARAMVLLIDQLEDIFNLDEARERFARVVDVLRHVVENVPSAVVVISCLDDLYSEVRPYLMRPALDRIERDPEPIRLTSQRSLEEIEALIGRRLKVLYEWAGVHHQDDDPIFPFCHKDLEKLTTLRTRDVLDWCRQYQEKCLQAGSLVDDFPIDTPLFPPAGVAPAIVSLEQEWNDFRTGFSQAPPEEDEALLDLLAVGVAACTEEFQPHYTFTCERQNAVLIITAPTATGEREMLTVGICNKAPQGGALARQIEAVEEQAGANIPVLVRCSEYPINPKTKIARQLGEFLRRGGRRVVVEDSDWRAIMAYQQFHAGKSHAPVFYEWLRAEKPLSQLKSLRELLGLDPLTLARMGDAGAPALLQAAPRPKQAVQVPSSPAARNERAPSRAQTGEATPSGPLLIGQSAGLSPKPVTLELQSLTTHAAFLGSPGSGKTTLALAILEQALERGIPAVMVDRKGDLCGYVRIEWWAKSTHDSRVDARERCLRDKLDVRLYTPGEPRGRPLSLPVVPVGIAELPTPERNKIATHAASALAAMMNYGDSTGDQARLVILSKAIELLGETAGGKESSLEDLVEVIHNQDPALVNAIGRLDTKHFSKLVEHLETLRLNRSELLSSQGDVLDPQQLFGEGVAGRSGKIPLSIISTKFLGDNASIEFWVARLLVEVGRWASKHPSASLQAILLLDEADLYLPAQSKPATKEPLQDLLRRARSAGLGVFLATQSPGDLDYKARDNIRTWFVGRVAEARAIDKLKPLLSECRMNVANKLPSQGVGEFFLLSGGGHVTEFRAERSLLEIDQLPEDEIVRLAHQARASVF
jgi:Predicted ATPase